MRRSTVMKYIRKTPTGILSAADQQIATAVAKQRRHTWYKWYESLTVEQRAEHYKGGPWEKEHTKYYSGKQLENMEAAGWTPPVYDE